MPKLQFIPVNLLTRLGVVASFNKITRDFLLNQINQRMFHDLVLVNPDNRPLKVQEDKYALGKALISSVRNAFERGHLSKKSARGLLSVFLGNVFFGGFYRRADFVKRHGFRPPMFITISPEGACNLKCIGCYAASTPDLGKLPFHIFDQIIRDAKESWDANFFVISGGEPLIYKSEGKSLLDIARIHSDCFFLMYTNGTVIDKKMAQKLAELGNITPSISVEGLEQETDERRGKGVFKKILTAMQNLRDAGVPFGLSITATCKNAELIVSKEFTDFFFKQQGAVYGWIFHYMPIGREFTLKLLPTPEQRVNLLHKIWKFVREEEIFIADFWNSGTASDGCICAARGGGYFYIDWNGDVMPCVFIPYSTHNIVDVYKNGGNLDTVISSDLFAKIRDWQAQYGYKMPAEKIDNWLCPCIIRDHHANLYEIVKSTGAHPVGEDAKEALLDQTYHEGLIKYGNEIGRLTSAEWQKEYLAPNPQKT